MVMLGSVSLAWPPWCSLQPLWTVAGPRRRDAHLIPTPCKGSLGLAADLSHRDSQIPAHRNFSIYGGLRVSLGASLVAQWLKICLPMQGTWVQALVREDPTCRGAARPVSHNN